MSWIHRYQLFLFDFDGLLVNTEELHYLAYQQMMRARGVELLWSFERYCMSAHYSSDKLRNDIFHDYPALMAQDPTWQVLYKEKQSQMERLVHTEAVHLMPGARALLTSLQNQGLNHAVVTHSPFELITLVKDRHPVLKSIPHWITRKDYTHPKPHPECYQIAIERYSQPGDRIVGFEDSPRGIQALLGTSAEAVLVTKVPYPEIPTFIQQGVKKRESLQDISL